MPRSPDSARWLAVLDEVKFDFTLLPDGFVLPDPLKGGHLLPVMRPCGHYQTVQVRLIDASYRDKWCFSCAPSRHRYSRSDWLSKLDSNGITLAPGYSLPADPEQVTPVEFLGTCGHRKVGPLVTVASISPSACRYCSHSKREEWFAKAKANNVDLIGELPPHANTSTIVKVRRRCGCVVEVSLKAAIDSPDSHCSKCRFKKSKVNSINSSHGEKELARFLEITYELELKRNYRSLGFELDIFFPKLRLAIEYNGEYWHSSKFLVSRYGLTSVEYHSRKSQLCLEQGIRLAYVWEEDWKKNREEVLAALDLFLSSRGQTIAPIISRFTSTLDEAVDGDFHP